MKRSNFETSKQRSKIVKRQGVPLAAFAKIRNFHKSHNKTSFFPKLFLGNFYAELNASSNDTHSIDG